MKALFLVALVLASRSAASTAMQQLASQPRLESEQAIVNQLASLLSKDATLVLPSSPDAERLLGRVAAPRISPGYAAIVEAATEGDVQHTVG